jgi:hypothetical protein
MAPEKQNKKTNKQLDAGAGVKGSGEEKIKAGKDQGTGLTRGYGFVRTQRRHAFFSLLQSALHALGCGPTRHVMDRKEPNAGLIACR